MKMTERIYGLEKTHGPSKCLLTRHNKLLIFDRKYKNKIKVENSDYRYIYNQILIVFK